MKKTLIPRLIPSGSFLAILFVILACLFPDKGFAGHVYGGNLSFECLGDNQYEVTLTLYNDGLTEELRDSALIYVVDMTDNTIHDSSIALVQDTNTIRRNDLGVCYFSEQEIKIIKWVYKTTFTLPVNTGGYKIVYQICCRSGAIININRPIWTGSTFYADITRESLLACNDGPVFRKDPPLLLCADEIVNVDGSARDNEGDRIEYKYCTGLSGLTRDCGFYLIVKNSCRNVVNKLARPPYEPIVYEPGYSFSQPYGVSVDGYSVDFNTGAITGVLSNLGQYSVSICIEEYRGGVLMSRSNRDFQLNLTDCIQQQLFVPNAFSPNGDGLNDIYRIQAAGFETMDLKIFNRWGNLVFHSTDIKEGWDGTYNGKQLSNDVFAYQLILGCAGDNSSYEESGSITLLR